MKVLFIARHCAYLRNFESAIRALAARGHAVRLAVEKEDAMDSRRMIEHIMAEHPNVTLTAAPSRARDESPERVRQLRLAIDYIRFRDPMYNRTPHLRARAEDRAPEGIVRLIGRPVVRRRPGRALVSRGLRWIERCLAPSAPVVDWLRAEAPDLVLITPLIELGSPQFDYLQAAQSLGLRTALPVTSWDHLSSKALIRSAPDLVLVWNDTQKDEAVHLHRVANRLEIGNVVGDGQRRWIARLGAVVQPPVVPRNEPCALAKSPQKWGPSDQCAAETVRDDDGHVALAVRLHSELGAVCGGDGVAAEFG